MPVSAWSETPSNNATADSASGIVWSEGQAPSSINDSARAMMAEIKKDFTNTINTNGRQKFPNGLELKWGYNAGGADSFQTFPVAFSTHCLFVSAQPTSASLPTTTLLANSVESLGVTGFTYRLRQSLNGGLVGQSAAPFFWFAIGR